MKSLVSFPPRLFLACFAYFAGHFLAVRAEEPPSGAALAEQLRAAAPEENSTITGVLHIRAGSNRKDVPIVCKIETGSGSNSWRTLYDAGGDHLIVIHSTNEPNQYLYATHNGPTNSIAPADAALALAGSDFSLADLGLDFLHWPTQTLRSGEMRLGQPCYVLDSSLPPSAAGPSGIVRVRSYIDKESGGILVAEASNAQNVVLKEFSLRGSFFRKVHGQWRLEKMEMHDRQKHSQTIMQFDISQ